MRLVIRALKLNHDPLSQAILGEFDERGGTIGRSDSSKMRLPDPERHVSRLQAEVTFAAGSFSLRNVGGSNPIIVNGRPVGPGEGVTLRHQDYLLMGSYELHVDLQTPAATRRLRDDRAPVDPRTVISASAGEDRTGPPRQPAAPIANAAAGGPFADLLGASGTPAKDDPFADLLSPALPASRAPKGHAVVQSAAPAPSRSTDDFDPFESSSASPREPHAACIERPDHPLSDLLGLDATTPGIDTMFGLKDANAAAEDAVAGFLKVTDAPPVRPAVDDPFAFLQDNPPTQSHGPASADHTPALQAESRPPPVRSAEPVRVPPPSPRQPAPQETVPHDELWAAFCEGVQVSPPSSQRLTPELMRAIGGTLRHAVEGTVQLNMMRATVTQELHVAVTVIKPKGNNPLKFAPDATAALMQILQPPRRGFMAGPEAMQDAMNDLIGRSLGTMEGTRAALHGVLERFQPVKLERQLASGGMLDRLVPMNRRAHLWELYLKHHGRIIESACEDFDELFGKAFAKAYEENAQRVSAARRAPS